MKEYERRTPRSHALFEAAARRTPLGVHSNYRALDPYPFYVRRAEGVTLYDVDGHAYLDFNMGFGGLASGHAHPKIVEALTLQLSDGTLYGYEWGDAPEIADRLCRRFGMAQLRFEARPARGDAPRRTHRPRPHRPPLRDQVRGMLPRFARHVARRGETDRRAGGPGPLSVLGARRTEVPGRGSGKDAGRAVQSDLAATRAIAREHATGSLAAIIVEPLPMNMGHILPEEGFLTGLGGLAHELDALLIYDEVKTGASTRGVPRVASGWRPTSCCSASRSPAGPRSPRSPPHGPARRGGTRKIPHAGTFNSNPFSLACYRATLDHILTEEYLQRSSELCRTGSPAATVRCSGTGT